MRCPGCPQPLRPALIAWLVMTAGLWCAAPTQAQTTNPSEANANTSAALGELQSQVQELKQMVLQLQQQTVDSRNEIAHLRQELETRRSAGSGAVSSIDEQSPAYASSTTAQL